MRFHSFFKRRHNFKPIFNFFFSFNRVKDIAILWDQKIIKNLLNVNYRIYARRKKKTFPEYPETRWSDNGKSVKEQYKTNLDHKMLL